MSRQKPKRRAARTTVAAVGLTMLGLGRNSGAGPSQDRHIRLRRNGKRRGQRVSPNSKLWKADPASNSLFRRPPPHPKAGPICPKGPGDSSGAIWGSAHHCAPGEGRPKGVPRAARMSTGRNLAPKWVREAE